MRKRFTLIEIIAVCGIIGVLAALGFAGYSYANRSARESATRALLAKISAGLEAVRVKTGGLPGGAGVPIRLTVSSGEVTEIRFGAAIASPISPVARKEFLRVVEGQTLVNRLSGNTVRDRWGGEIRYRYPGTCNPGSFDLVAPGVDGKFGTGNDDDPPSTLAGYQSDGEWACDDLANF